MKHEFAESISALQLAFLGKNYHNSYDFWYVIDHLDNNTTIKYLDKLLKSKLLLGNDYVKVCSIVHQHKHLEEEWSVRQKRSCVMLLLTHWDHISYESPEYIYY